MKNELIETYSGLAEKYQNRLSELKKRSRLVSILRGLLFLGIIAILIFTWNYGVWINVGVVGFLIIPFLILVKLNVELNFEIRRLQELLIINRNEISGLKGDYSVFKPGNEFIDSDHPYSFDLDIFGEGSIYQLLNRTCTMGGSVLLAEDLKKKNGRISEINQKQAAIQEMAALLDWRQNFNATGKIELEAGDDHSDNTAWFQSNKQNFGSEAKFYDEMIAWLKNPFYYASFKFLRYYLFIFPAISVVLFVLMLAGIFPVMDFILYGLLQLVVIGWNLKKINLIHGQIGRKTQILKKYSSLLSLIEKQKFNSVFLRQLTGVSGIENKDASKALRKLQSLSGGLDNRLNILF
jgi:hypothetical protein